MVQAAPKTARRAKRRRWVFRALLALVLIVLLLLGGAYSLWTGTPAGWSDATRRLAAMPDDQQQVIAQSLENRVLREHSDLRDDQPWKMRLDLVEANTWLARRLPPWARAQGAPIPREVGQMAVWADGSHIALGAQVQLSGVTQVVSAGVLPDVNRSGQVVLTLDWVRIGKIPIPIESAMDQLGLSQNPQFSKVAPYVEQALQGLVLQPEPIDNTRQVRVLKVEVLEDAVELTLRTEPMDAP